MSRSRLLAAAACLVLVSAGCGPSGHGAETDPEKGSDAEMLNAALGREMTILGLYVRELPKLDGEARAIGRRLRAHQQEYVDALTKALRGLGGDVEAEPEAPPLPDGAAPADVLRAALELEAAAMAGYVDAAPRLFTAAPRTLAAALAAGHAQALVVLREALGTRPADAIRRGFDGAGPPTSDETPTGRG